MLTFSPTVFRISSKSSGVRNVLRVNSVNHFLFFAWSCKGKTASTFFHSSCLGVMPAPPSSRGQQIIWWMCLNLSASVRGSEVKLSAGSASGCNCRTPFSQSFILDRYTTSARIFSSAALTKTRRDVSSPRRTSVVNPVSARARINCLNFAMPSSLSVRV